MDNKDDRGFSVEPPAELDAQVFAKVAPVLKENKQIHSNKRWFQLWMPVASTAALTAFGFWFLNKKANTGSSGIEQPEMDLQSFAALDLDEDSLDLASNLEVIEELDMFEAYSEDDENS